MQHYICTECGGEASAPKVCETEGCKKEGEALSACNCTDDLHAEVKERNESSQDTEE